MLDVIALLRREHRSLQLLIEEYMTADDPPQVAAEICTELLLHMTGEEQVLYPVVETELQGGKYLVEKALEDHEGMTLAIADLDRLGYDHPDGGEVMRDIIAAAVRHIEDEEHGILFDLKVLFDADELAAMGDDLTETRARLEAEIDAQEVEGLMAEAEAEMHGAREPAEVSELQAPEALDQPEAADAEEPEEPEEAEEAEATEVIVLTDLTRRELYELAAEEGIAGRSRMSRDELIDALATD